VASARGYFVANLDFIYDLEGLHDADMSFSADKVNMLKGAFSQRRFSSSKDPSDSGELFFAFFWGRGGYVMR
jgi:hypothetical protein